MSDIQVWVQWSGSRWHLVRNHRMKAVCGQDYGLIWFNTDHRPKIVDRCNTCQRINRAR